VIPPPPERRPCGIVFVGYGAEKYKREAERAARSAARHSPAIPRYLVSDAPFASDAFDAVIVREDFLGEHIDKVLVVHAPCDRILYLDSDTRVVGPVDDGFAILDRFVYAGVGVGTPERDAVEGVPDALPSLNGGAFFVRNDADGRGFLDLWRRIVLESPPRAGGGRRDQPSLRRTLWESDIRFASLGAEWNLHVDKAMRLDGPVRVLHGRPDARLDEAERFVAEWSGRRGYVPGVGCVPDRNFWSHRRLLRFALRAVRAWWSYATTKGAKRWRERG